MGICRRCKKKKDCTIGIWTYKAIICNDCIEELIKEQKLGHCGCCHKDNLEIKNLYAEVYFDGKLICTFSKLLCNDCYKKYKELDQFKGINKLSNGEDL